MYKVARFIRIDFPLIVICFQLVKNGVQIHATVTSYERHGVLVEWDLDFLSNIASRQHEDLKIIYYWSFVMGIHRGLEIR